MKITSFNIYEFGILEKQSLSQLPNGLIIFLGQNEAGKSTTLEFFRTVLTGFPSARSKKSREGLFAKKNPQLGGMIELETSSQGTIKLERTRKNFNLFSKEGSLLLPQIYENILAGTTREIYTSLYGFSLAELQNLDALEEDDVKSVLYGTSFGLGLYSPQKALAQIENTINSKTSKSLVYNESVKNKFKENALKIEEINLVIQELNEKNIAIDDYYLEHDKLFSKLQEIRENKEKQNLISQYIKKKIDAWPLYEDYILQKKKIERIQLLSENFPEDAVQRLNSFQNEEYQLEKNNKILQFKKSQLLDSLSKKEHNILLVNELEKIKQLIEYKGSYRNAFIKKPYILDAIQRTEEELNKFIQYFGSGWTVEKINNLNYSLDVYKIIDEYTNIFDKEEAKIQEIQNNISRLSQESLLIQDELSSYTKQFDALIVKESPIPLTLRDNIQKQLRRAQDANEQLPHKNLLLSRAKNELLRSMQLLPFDISDSEENLSKLCEAQDSLLEKAKSICSYEDKTEQSKQTFLQFKKEHDKLEEQYEYLIKENQKHIHLQRSTLQKKRYSIQRIKSLLQMHADEEERLVELQGQYDEILSQLPIKTTNIVILLLGFCSLCMGTVLLISGLVYGIKEFDISFLSQNAFIIKNLPQYLALPDVYINHSPFAFLLFLLGFTSIYLNIPLYSPDRKKKLHSLAQISARKESLIIKLEKNNQEYKQRINELAIADEKNNIFNELERIDIELDAEQEQLFNKEKLLKETASIELQLDKSKENLEQSQKQYFEAENSLQKLRYDWQEEFVVFNISDIPSPKAAETYFARIDKIRLSKDNLTSLEAEIQNYTNIKENLFSLSTKVFIQEDLTELYKTNITSFFSKIQDLLNEEYENDKIIERKNQIYVNITNLNSKIDSISHSIENNENIYAKSKVEYEETKLQWRNFLSKEAFDENLTPHTAKAFLNQVEKFNRSSSKLEELKHELNIHNTELNRLAEPVQALLQKLSRKVILRLDQAPDYLASLDTLYSDAEKAKEVFTAKISIEEQLEQVNNEINYHEVERNNLHEDFNNLLKKMNLNTLEEFKDEINKVDEYNLLSKSIQNLEDTLSFISTPMSLDAFLKEFEGIDLQHLRNQKVKADEYYSEIITQEDEVSSLLINKKNMINNIESSNLLTEIKQEKLALEEENSILLENYLSYALARQCIQNAKQKFELERQPELIKTASEIFSHITGGKWENITSSIEDNTLKLNPRSGLPLTPDKLSQGTKEQLYLSLRLAYIKNSSKYKESLPLIMDDILVNFDTTRSTQTARTLAKLIEDSHNNSNNLGQQILFFTCHPHIATILQENVPQSTLYTINEGKILQSI